MRNFFFSIRRLVLLYVAIFLAHESWCQVLLFMALSVSFILYLGFTNPYKSKKENSLNLFNEGITIIVAYIVMSLNGLCHDAVMYEKAGVLIVYSLYLNWSVNGLLIA